MNKLIQEFTRKAVLEYARERVRQSTQYLGPRLFPEQPTNELTYEYWRDQNRLPVMASVQAFGAEAAIAGRDGAVKVSGEIPPIKRKINLNERLFIALKREGAGDIAMVRDQLYNDIDNMVDSVLARIEAMRIEALATGQLALAENGVVVNVNFGVPVGNQQALLAVNQADGQWNQAAAEPITMIQDWTNAVVAASGVRPTRALTSNTVVANMLRNAQVRTMIWGDNGNARAVSLPQLNALLQTLDLPQIATYDLQVRAENGVGVPVAQPLFPANRFVLLPPTPVGETLMGPTAEALLDNEVGAEEAPGVYAVVTQEAEPPAIWTKAAACAFPTFPAVDQVFLAQVLG